jgi:hypothetical protein
VNEEGWNYAFRDLIEFNLTADGEKREIQQRSERISNLVHEA